MGEFITFLAWFVYFNFCPESMVSILSDFFSGIGFNDFIVAGLVVGSLLGMDWNVLIHARVRFFLLILGAVLVSLLGAALS
ncbi:2-hydroxycarboxylate transporter family protein [Halalkalibacter oceani]|uniref:2-hydroxycarboxylate transporter family protein n=1 Tax=Halalkalibacter oceani TaxID=1653776 RepID=UPI003D9CB5AC